MSMNPAHVPRNTFTSNVKDRPPITTIVVATAGEDNELEPVDDTVLVDATVGACDILLASVVLMKGRTVTVRKVDSEANNVVVKCKGDATPDARDWTNKTLTAVNDYTAVYSDGVAWLEFAGDQT